MDEAKKDGCPGGGATAQEVARVFAELLKVDAAALAPDANFFTLGGSSLQAFALVSRLSQRFGVDIPLAQMVQRATPEGLTQLIAELAAAGPADEGEEEGLL